MKKLMIMGLAAVFAMTGMVSAQNLLSNGDLTIADPSDPLIAASWSEWNSGGWVNRELSGNNYPNGGYQYAIGNAGAINNGAFQNVAVADDGAEYFLIADVMLDDWWSPSAYIKMEFKDATDTLIGFEETWIVASSWDGGVAQPWAKRVIKATAPAGTASITAVLGAYTSGDDGAGPGNGGGTARFDNVSLQVVPEPATLGLLGLSGLALWIVRRRI